MKTRDLFSTVTFVLISASLSAAPGCGSGPQPVDGTGGVVASGGAANGSGGAPSGSGGVVSASGGAPSASGGAVGSVGGTSSGGGAVGGSTAGGGAGNSSGGGGSADDVMASEGCGQAAPTGGEKTIDVNGTMREYIIAIPESYDPEKPYRLVFAWHPWGGSASQVAGNGPGGYYGLLGESDGEAIFVSPEGLPFGGSSLGWGNEGGQDIAFLEAMMERFDAELCFDHNRIFSTGFSFGGMMSNAVACTGLPRAVAPMAGNSMVSGCEAGTQPVAYMGFHGEGDSVVEVEGGRTARDIFVERNGCGEAQPSDSDWCNAAGPNYQPCACTTYEGCAEGYPVTWCEFTGDHMTAPSSAPTIWEFFAQF